MDGNEANGRETRANGGRSNWSRWGADDERGAANFVTSDVVRAAAGLVRQGRVYSLALPIQARGVPVFPRRGPSQHFMTLDGGDYAAGLRRKGGYQSADDYVVMATHGSTHIDALAHVWYGDRLYNGFPGTTVRSSGATRCGIEKLRHLVGRGVLLDLPRSIGCESLPGGHVVTPDELRACAAAERVELREGDVLLIRTGWPRVFAAEGATAFFASEPGIGEAAAEWIAHMGFSAVGSDNYGIEVVPTEHGNAAPVHQRLIRDFGVYLLELLVLDELARDHVFECLFVAAPLLITGGVGSPLNPLAVA